MKVSEKKYVSIIVLCFVIIVLGAGFVFMFLPRYPLEYKEEIEKCAKEFSLSPALVASVINAESSFDKDCVSSQGAIGLMQILPSTATYIAKLLGENDFKTSQLFEPETNIRFGCFYLKYLQNKFENQNVSLSAYNAGEGTVKKWLSNQNYSEDGKTLVNIPYEETRNYIKKIENSYKHYERKFHLNLQH